MRGARGNQRGQAILFMALFLPMLFGMAALAVDFGLVFIYNDAFSASTQAAALAGAEAMSQPGATVASTTSAVTTYSGTAGNKNATRTSQASRW